MWAAFAARASGPKATLPNGTEMSSTPCLPPAWTTERTVEMADRLDDGEIAVAVGADDRTPVGGQELSDLGVDGVASGRCFRCPRRTCSCRAACPIPGRPKTLPSPGGGLDRRTLRPRRTAALTATIPMTPFEMTLWTAVGSTAGLVWSSAMTVLILWPLMPPLAFCTSMRAMNAPGTPLYSGPAGPVHEQTNPMVIGALDAAPAGELDRAQRPGARQNTAPNVPKNRVPRTRMTSPLLSQP